MKKSFLFLILALISGTLFANDSTLLREFKKHVTYLADDKLEGRETGSKGEKMAYRYIIKEFKEIGLLAKGHKNSYLHPFTFTAGKTVGKSNNLRLNNTDLKLNEDFYPLTYSSNGSAKGSLVNVGYGMEAVDEGHNDYENKSNLQGKLFMMEWHAPDGISYHSKYGDHADTRKKISVAIEKGATGIIFYNSNTEQKDPVFRYTRRITPADIPVIFITKEGMKKIGKGESNIATFEVQLEKIENTGHNVAAFIDNKAKHSIVIGAHYDHLGYGGEHNSLYRGEPLVHNGADDNASGTAMIIELARELKKGAFDNYNYLFLAFSGEEMGLFGSKAWVENPSIANEDVNYMINFDMVGRLDKEDKKISVNGVGTSPKWQDLLDKIDRDGISFKTSESGIGPSDHTSFYLKDMPVIHFFSGTHEDYHKPTDDIEKVNFDGMVSVYKITLDLIGSLNNADKIAFTKTKDEDNKNTPRFTVSLGVIPDYMFEGKGMKIDGVSDNRPASKAGILAKDIVVQMGDYEVLDMMGYMKALSKFKKGDSTKVKVMRGEETMEFDITF